MVILPSDATVHSCDTVPLTHGERCGDDARNTLVVMAMLSLITADDPTTTDYQVPGMNCCFLVLVESILRE